MFFCRSIDDTFSSRDINQLDISASYLIFGNVKVLSNMWPFAKRNGNVIEVSFYQIYCARNNRRHGKE